MRRLLPLVLCLVALAPATAAAQDNPFGPIPQVQQAAPTPTAAPSTNADEGGVNRTVLILIALGVAVVFFGLGYLITRDARSHLTEDDRRALERERSDEERKRGKVTKQKARAAGKRQRQARKAQRRR